MTRSTPRRKNKFYPAITGLESRRLLAAAVTCLGQDGQDLVGPDASQGPDGIQDLHLQFSGLSGTVGEISIQAPGGFEWATAPDPSGAALAEFFPSSTAGVGDLYLNPQVRSDLPPAGGSLPLGGSTGSLIQLANGVVLTITIDYQSPATAATLTVPVSKMVSPTDPMPAISVPANVVNAFQVVGEGQDATGQYYEQGFDHLVVTATNGITFNAATFSQVVWNLSDQAGLAWDSTSATLGHNHVYATLRSGTNNIVDLYFAPERDEAPASGSSSATMQLQVSLPGNSRVYVTPFAGSNWIPADRTNPFDNQPPPSPAPTTEAELRAMLASTSPEYDTINLPANTTIVLTQPLEITHSVDLIGNNSTLLFQQGSSAAWPASASGAIYVSTPSYVNIQLELTGFTIKFDMSAPIRWSNPAGAGPALFDPENNPAGIQHAVIDTRDSNTNLNMTVLTLSKMTIDGPPAFDGSSFASISSLLGQGGDATDQYVGEQDMDLIRTNDLDTGTIQNSSLQGGEIEVFGGPWTLADNRVLGSTAQTYSPGAFGLHSPHDVVVEGNQVSQADPGGREFRLVNLAVSGFNNLIEDNSFGGGAGQIGNEVAYTAPPGQFYGINDPEIILAESSYGVLFEGRPGAVSADGRLLVLPDLRASAYAGSTGPGLVVSILAEQNGSGASGTSLAGEWFRVADQVSLTANNTIELLMEDPLPALPQGGYYIVEVTGGFVNNSFLDNQIDLAGKSSTGIVLSGADYGSRIIGNEFVGGSSSGEISAGTAISLTSVIDSAQSGSGAFPLPVGWTALPNLGTVVEDNTIRDFPDGILVGVQHAVNYWQALVVSSSETGRVFVTASVENNVFEYDSSFLSAWSTSYLSFGNAPAQSSTPPTVTIGSGWSPQAPGPYGTPRFPWTVGAAITVNGADTPVFIDPAENVVTVQTNSVESIAASGVVSNVSGQSGQVYAGVVNGVSVAPVIATQTYDGQPYFPFNLDNLNVAAAAENPPPPPPPPPPPAVSAAPAGLTVGQGGANQLVLSWQPSSGATYYVLERSQGGGGAWQVAAPSVTTTYVLDTGLEPATTYSYRVLAVSSAGESAPSAIVTARTPIQPDVLAVAISTMNLTRRALFAGPVATFTDANKAARASQFVARIAWGDGTSNVAKVAGGDGDFVVNGSHKYARIGRYTVKVTVIMAGRSAASVKGSAKVVVSNPTKREQRVRLIHRPAPKARRPAKGQHG